MAREAIHALGRPPEAMARDGKKERLAIASPEVDRGDPSGGHERLALPGEYAERLASDGLFRLLPFPSVSAAEAIMLAMFAILCPLYVSLSCLTFSCVPS